MTTCALSLAKLPSLLLLVVAVVLALGAPARGAAAEMMREGHFAVAGAAPADAAVLARGALRAGAAGADCDAVLWGAEAPADAPAPMRADAEVATWLRRHAVAEADDAAIAALVGAGATLDTPVARVTGDVAVVRRSVTACKRCLHATDGFPFLAFARDCAACGTEELPLAPAFQPFLCVVARSPAEPADARALVLADGRCLVHDTASDSLRAAPCAAAEAAPEIADAQRFYLTADGWLKSASDWNRCLERGSGATVFMNTCRVSARQRWAFSAARLRPTDALDECVLASQDGHVGVAGCRMGEHLAWMA